MALLKCCMGIHAAHLKSAQPHCFLSESSLSRTDGRSEGLWDALLVPDTDSIGGPHAQSAPVGPSRRCSCLLSKLISCDCLWVKEDILELRTRTDTNGKLGRLSRFRDFRQGLMDLSMCPCSFWIFWRLVSIASSIHNPWWQPGFPMNHVKLPSTYHSTPFSIWLKFVRRPTEYRNALHFQSFAQCRESTWGGSATLVTTARNKFKKEFFYMIWTG